jgi:hypothetical protein
MAIYYGNLLPTLDAGGRLVLSCKTCKGPAQDANSGTVLLKVCSNCGMPLGEWETETERQEELKDLAERL